CPTLPGANVVPFCSVPLLPPWISVALPSPGYHAVMLEGGGAHVRHLPALPALKMPWISEAVRERLKISISSNFPLRKKLFSACPMVKGAFASGTGLVLVTGGPATPST